MSAATPISHSLIEQFAADMRANGIDIDEPIIADGKRHRYYVHGDKRNTRNAWAILHLDGVPNGVYGCWKMPGKKFRWKPDGTVKITPAERAALREIARQGKAERDAELILEHAEAAARAQAIMDAGVPVSEHPYLTAKNVPSNERLRVGAWHYLDKDTGELILVSDRALLVPMRDRYKTIHSVQAIIEDERDQSGFRKQYLKGGSKTGHYFAIGQPTEKTVLICEGLATGLSLWQCTQHCVLVAFDVGNLVPVAKAFREWQPDYRIVICADNDAWTTIGPIKNPGVHYATKAAKAVNGILAMPEFLRTETKPTDFNDLHTLGGEEIVREIVNEALAQEVLIPSPALAPMATVTVRPLIASSKECSSGAPSLRSVQAADGEEESHEHEGGGRVGDHTGGDADFSGEDAPTDRLPAATLQDFLAYLPSHQYLYRKTRELWPAASVNAVIPSVADSDGKTMKANLWLDNNQPVQQMTWAPGEPELIRGRLISNGDWIEDVGSCCFNLYVPPKPMAGSSDSAGPWIEHVHRVYPTEAIHIIKWLAHRVQKPGKKINHALVLGGEQGIGKDTMLDPISYAVGSSNFNDVSPAQLVGRFNSFIKSVILRISEARDLGDVDRYQFYEHTKVYTAAPPNVLRCDEKNLREHGVMNVCGVIMTTNHKSNGIYLPADDRRHFVAWSPLTKEEIPEGYFRELYSWYERGGIGHVAAYLRGLDLRDFDAKAPPPKTEAFWAIVDANRPPQDAALADALDFLEHPSAITIDCLAKNPGIDIGFKAWIQDVRNGVRQLPHRLEEAGYTRVRQSGRKDGLWIIGKKRQVIYALKTLSERERQVAAAALCETRARVW